MKAAKLPTYCKATKDKEMDDFGSVICFLYIIILVIEQEKNHNFCCGLTQAKPAQPFSANIWPNYADILEKN